MKASFVSLALLTLITFAIVAAVPAAAQTVYENGPINGNVDAWTFNFGFTPTDSFTISGGNTTVTGLSFGAWLFAGDTLTSAEVSITSEPFGGTTYFDQDCEVSLHRDAPSTHMATMFAMKRAHSAVPI